MDFERVSLDDRLSGLSRMNGLKVLVCDDEPLALQRLVFMLGSMPDVAVVVTARTGDEALRKVAESSPDLLLLDIEMPGTDGFDVVNRLRADALHAPLVAFVTAHRKFAPEAFETGVIDFLPKPVRRTRLETVVARANVALAALEARRRLLDMQAQLEALRLASPKRRDDDMWVSKRGSLVRIELDRIERVTAEGSYVLIHIGTASFLHREAMAAMEMRLAPRGFVRVHRSHLVRGDLVEAIRRTLHGGGELVLTCGTVVPLGRKYSQEARRRFLRTETK